MSQTVKSLMGFVRKMQQTTPAGDEVLVFRGHSKRAYQLHPSVMRSPELVNAEDAMLRELVATHPAEFASDRTTLEQLARAQHYSLPTRLLDVSWNPLVALYFASNSHPGSTGEVIAFRVKKDQVKFYDSDTASCIANLAHLKPTERLSIDLTLPPDDFHRQLPIRRLLHFIGVEKPHFQAEIVPGDLGRVVLVKPKRNSPRILVQAGAFLLFGMADSLDATPAPGITVERIMVNGNSKGDILKALDVVGINESTMFPEIDRAAKYIRDKV